VHYNGGVTNPDRLGRLGVWMAPERLTGRELTALAARLEAWGYSTLWVAETFGRDPFALTAALGAATQRLVLATGIANVYNRHPGVMQQGAKTVAEQTGGRFVLGLGVSSPQIVAKGRGLDYTRPLTHLREYLDAMEQAPYLAAAPPGDVPVVLAALGPKMLALAAQRTRGAHTYNVPPEHTASAHEVLGADAWLCVEQKVVLTTDAAQARATSAKVLKFYQQAPGYRKNWNRLGFTDDDVDQMSDRFVDAMVAWGDTSAIRARIDAHFDAGATHVCIQPLHPEHGIGAVDERVLEALAPDA
jgi:probable F420-dependent oxidoreductase